MKKYTSRNAPFGYTADADGKLVESPGQMETVREIIDLHEMGSSFTAIAKMLNEAGTPTARDGKWYASTVRSVVDHYYDQHGDEGEEPVEPSQPRQAEKPLALRIRDGELTSFVDKLYEGTTFEEEFIDSDTGKKSTRAHHVGQEDFILGDARSRAYDTLTREQQDALVTIPDPGFWHDPANPTMSGIDSFTVRRAQERARTINELLDRFKGDPRLKRELRGEIKSLTAENAFLREMDIHLRHALKRACVGNDARRLARAAAEQARADLLEEWGCEPDGRLRPPSEVQGKEE